MAKHIRIIKTGSHTDCDTSILEEAVNDGWEIISVVASGAALDREGLSFTLLKEDKVEED